MNPSITSITTIHLHLNVESMSCFLSGMRIAVANAFANVYSLLLLL